MLTRLLRRPHSATGQSRGGLLGPDALEVGPRWLRVGESWCRTLAVTGYPREVGLGWLEPVLNAPGTLDVAVHVEPIPSPVAAERLRRQLARLESTRRLAADRGRLADFAAEAAADDAAELADRIARGQAKLFRVGLTWALDTVRQEVQATLSPSGRRSSACSGRRHPGSGRPRGEASTRQPTSDGRARSPRGASAPTANWVNVRGRRRRRKLLPVE